MSSTDANYTFIAIDVGAYRSSSDSQIFNSSKAGTRLLSKQLDVPARRRLPNDENGLLCSG